MGIEITQKNDVVTEAEYLIDGFRIDSFVRRIVVSGDDEVLFVKHGLFNAYREGFVLSWESYLVRNYWISDQNAYAASFRFSIFPKLGEVFDVKFVVRAEPCFVECADVNSFFGKEVA